MKESTLIPIEDEADLDSVVGAELAVIYKHSPLCGLSTIAVREVRRFIERNPDTPVYLLDVIRNRDLARTVEAKLDVRHESPQVIVIRDGSAAWDASHRGVTADALQENVATSNTEEVR